jgi:hypothetical protein
MAYDSVHVLDSPLEASNRDFYIAGIAGAVPSKSFSIVSA